MLTRICELPFLIRFFHFYVLWFSVSHILFQVILTISEIACVCQCMRAISTLFFFLFLCRYGSAWACVGRNYLENGNLWGGMRVFMYCSLQFEYRIRCGVAAARIYFSIRFACGHSGAGWLLAWADCLSKTRTQWDRRDNSFENKITFSRQFDWNWKKLLHQLTTMAKKLSKLNL